MGRNTLARPRGTRDFGSEEMEARRWAERILRDTAETFGYREIATPVFEHLELFTMRSGEEIVHQLYTFEDKGGRTMALRPELTASVMRFFSGEMASRPKPVKVFYFGNCFRYERPQKGRYREFWQFGAECIGTDTCQSAAEIISLADGAVRATGLSGHRLRIGHLGILRGFLERLGANRKEIMPLIDKGNIRGIGYLFEEWGLSDELFPLLDLLSLRGDPDALEKGRKVVLGEDEGAPGWDRSTNAGGRTDHGERYEGQDGGLGRIHEEERCGGQGAHRVMIPGAGTDPGTDPQGAGGEGPFGLPALDGIREPRMDGADGTPWREMVARGFTSLERISAMLARSGITHTIDYGIARGLDYYTGMVFEMDVPSLGAEKQICGGGEYDLSDLFTLKVRGASGFAIGFDRLMMALESEGIRSPERKPAVGVIPTPGTEDTAFIIATDLRRAGIPTELELSGRNLRKSLAYMNEIGVSHAVILGDRELREGKVVVRNMTSGEQTEMTPERVKDHLAVAGEKREPDHGTE